MTATAEQIRAALAAPFTIEHLRFKPRKVAGKRALVVTYIDARSVEDRLDDALGIDGWQDAYRPLDGGALCRLRCLINGVWITKMDVGSPSEQSDEGDRRKASLSDALKRTAVKFGVGRYLYRIPAIWADYDPEKKLIVRPPELPLFALPPRSPPAADATPGPMEQALVPQRLRALYATMRIQRKTFAAALNHYGVTLPADFQEPMSSTEAEALAPLIPLSVIEQMEAAFEQAKTRKTATRK